MKKILPSQAPILCPRRFLFVDDHDSTRHGLMSLLSKKYPNVEFDHAHDYYSAVKAADQTDYDIVFMDIQLGSGPDGIDTTKALLNMQPELRVIVHTMHHALEYGKRAFEAGARGFLSKSNIVRTLEPAVDNVLSGRTYITDYNKKHLLVTANKKPIQVQLDGLTDRQLNVFQMIGRGYSLKEIADGLSISAVTVSKHKQNIRERLALKSMNELHRMAREYVGNP